MAAREGVGVVCDVDSRVRRDAGGKWGTRGNYQAPLITRDALRHSRSYRSPIYLAHSGSPDLLESSNGQFQDRQTPTRLHRKPACAAVAPLCCYHVLTSVLKELGLSHFPQDYILLRRPI
jgi:hypothetical protein